MGDANEHYSAIRDRLIKVRQTMLDSYVKEHFEAIEKYEKNFGEHAEEQAMFNKRTGQNKKLVEPTAFRHATERQINAYAAELEQEQKEDAQLKLELEQIAEQRQREDEKKRIEKEEEGLDPRRKAFRERMREMDEENQRNKDKGMEMG